MLIDGEWKSTSSGTTRAPVISATEDEIATVVYGDAKGACGAIDALEAKTLYFGGMRQCPT